MQFDSIKIKINAFLHNQSYTKYLYNTIWLFLDRFFKLGVALVVGIYVARYLGPEQFGMLNYATGFVGLFNAFTNMGLNNILVRDLVRGANSKDELLGSAFFLQTAGGFIVFVAIAIVLYFNNSVDFFSQILILIIASAEVFRGFGVIALYFQSRVEAKHITTASFFQSLFVSILKLSLVYFQAPLIYFAITLALDVILGNTSMLYIYTKKAGSILKWKIVAPLAKELLSNSWPLILYGLALHVQARIDQVMIGNILGKEEVGYYSVALKMIEILGMVPMVLASSFSPSIIQAKETGNDLYQSRLKEYYRLMFIVFIVTSVPLFFLSEFIIVIMYGEEFRPAGILLSLFSIRMLYTCMGVAKSSFIINENLFKYTMITAIIGAGTNVIFNYFLIPAFGAKGAIVATILSFSISIFIIDLFYHRTNKNVILMLKSMLSFWKIDIASAAKTIKK